MFSHQVSAYSDIFRCVEIDGGTDAYSYAVTIWVQVFFILTIHFKIEVHVVSLFMRNMCFSHGMQQPHHHNNTTHAPRKKGNYIDFNFEMNCKNKKHNLSDRDSVWKCSSSLHQF
jgi:hypothetical protein